MFIRFLTEDEIVDQLNPRMAAEGWAQLSSANARVLGAFSDDRLVKAMVLQLHPVIGPLVTLDEAHRDNGSVSRQLTDEMEAYLQREQARGWLVIADNPLTARLCERHGMTQLTSPVYLQTPD